MDGVIADAYHKWPKVDLPYLSAHAAQRVGTTPDLRDLLSAKMDRRNLGIPRLRVVNLGVGLADHCSALRSCAHLGCYVELRELEDDT